MCYRSLALLIAAFLGNGSAQTTTVTTWGSINGRAWVKLSSLAKTTYISGLVDGTRSGQAYIEATCKLVPLYPEPSRPTLNAFCDRLQITALLPAGVAIEDAVKGVDVFFDSPEHLRFRVLDAVGIFSMKAAGKSQSEIDKFLEVLRAALQSPPEQKR